MIGKHTCCALTESLLQSEGNRFSGGGIVNLCAILYSRSKPETVVFGTVKTVPYTGFPSIPIVGEGFHPLPS